jgi:putative effector of murein hydrolase
MSIKKPTDLLLVNVCCISAVGFCYNLVQPNTIAFTTSLYKINQIIKKKRKPSLREKWVYK